MLLSYIRNSDVDQSENICHGADEDHQQERDRYIAEHKAVDTPALEFGGSAVGHFFFDLVNADVPENQQTDRDR